MRPTGVNVREIPNNIVYQYLTVAGLEETVFGGKHSDKAKTATRQCKTRWRYSADLPSHRGYLTTFMLLGAQPVAEGVRCLRPSPDCRRSYRIYAVN